MPHTRLLALSIVALTAALVAAQTAPPPKGTPPQPDSVVLTDGEKLIGHLLRSNGSSVVFKSDLLGEITIDWSKIQELHAAESFAVVAKNLKLAHRRDITSVPQGPIDVAGQTITVHTEAGAARTVPVADAAHVIDVATVQRSILRSPGFFEDWAGAITGGATLVQATQQSRAFSGGVHLVHAVPTETWLPPRDRTLVDFTASEGFVVQPGTPKVKTEIIHANVERDEYFSGSRVYGFGQAIFDHNYSQGLDLQQDYGGGIGWTAIDKPNLTLDFKGSATFVKQQFQTAGFGHNLAGSNFAETLLRKFPRGMILTQQVAVTPAWNEMHAWAAVGGASITAPVYKRVSFNLSVLDNFLNDPAPGFHKNSFQALTGLTYTLR
jgi:hypothetical protein